MASYVKPRTDFPAQAAKPKSTGLQRKKPMRRVGKDLAKEQ